MERGHDRVIYMTALCSHLWYTVDISHNFDDVVQRKQRVALQLGVDVLALRAGGQQLHQRVVVGQSSVFIRPLSLGAHHLQQHREGGAVVVEHQHVLAAVHQLDPKVTVTSALNSFSADTSYSRKLSCGLMRRECRSHLRHHFVLTLLHILPVGFHDGFQELEVLNVSPVCFDAVDEVMDHAVADLVAQLVVVHKDVTHRLRLQQLGENTEDLYNVSKRIYLQNRKTETKKSGPAHKKLG